MTKLTLSAALLTVLVAAVSASAAVSNQDRTVAAARQLIPANNCAQHPIGGVTYTCTRNGDGVRFHLYTFYCSNGANRGWLRFEDSSTWLPYTIRSTSAGSRVFAYRQGCADDGNL